MSLAHGLALFGLLGLFVLPGAEAQQTRYIAFGDSITVGFDRHDETCPCQVFPDCQQMCGYPQRLETLINDAGGNASVLNRGVGGEATTEGLSRIDQVLAEGGDVLLLMEGTNDITRRIATETTLFNLNEMATRAAQEGFETVHVTVIPRFPRATVDSENVVNAFFASGLRDLAFDNGRQLVDVFETFSTTPNLFTTYYTDLPNDPVGHTNSAGFDLMAEVFFNALTGIDTVPPVLGRVFPANGTTDVGALVPLEVRLYDFGSGIDTRSTTLFVNSQAVGFSSSGDGSVQDLTFVPQTPYSTDVTVRVRSSDVAGNTMDREAMSFSVDPFLPGPCVSDTTTLCIDRNVGDARFQLRVNWNTAMNGGQQGTAISIPLAPIGLRRGGLFSFFDLNNPEILVKVLDGCTINNRFWVFVAPTTSLGYDLEIIDTVAAQQGAPSSDFQFTVSNPDGRAAPPVSATAAFMTCGFDAP